VRKVLAIVRNDLLTRGSYRLQILVSFASLFGLLIPIYFVTRALEATMKSSLQGEGGDYFTFVLVGMIVMRYCTAVVNSLPTAFTAALRFGTLEALFATPTPVRVLVAGMSGFPILWATAEASVLAAAGAFLGARIQLAYLLPGVVILALIVLAYLSFSIFGVALLLAFRTTGAIPGAILLATNLVSGVFYPVHVIPTWVQKLSAVLPLTYGLQALRRTILNGASLQVTWVDLATLCLFLIVLLPASWLALTLSLRYARRTGTLAQY
jgi:ABC-2 type transport system permease protein